MQVLGCFQTAFPLAVSWLVSSLSGGLNYMEIKIYQIQIISIPSRSWATLKKFYEVWTYPGLYKIAAVVSKMWNMGMRVQLC